MHNNNKLWKNHPLGDFILYNIVDSIFVLIFKLTKKGSKNTFPH